MARIFMCSSMSIGGCWMAPVISPSAGTRGVAPADMPVGQGNVKTRGETSKEFFRSPPVRCRSRQSRDQGSWGRLVVSRWNFIWMVLVNFNQRSTKNGTGSESDQIAKTLIPRRERKYSAMVSSPLLQKYLAERMSLT